MKRWTTWLGVLISVSCAIYFVGTIAHHWQSLSQTPMHTGVIVAVGISSLVYIVSYIVSARAWQLSILSLSGAVSCVSAARMLILSQFGKYLPGNVGHHVGRALLARRSGLSNEVVVASMLLDTALLVLAGAACSLPALALLQNVLEARGVDGFKAVAVAMLVSALLLIALMAVPYVRTKLRDLAVLVTTRKISLLAQAWAFHCLNFVLGVVVLYLLIDAITAAADSPLALTHSPELLGIYAAAWLLGFLMPGAPAGLGVREVVLLLGLTPLVGGPSALSTAALLRLVTTAGDGIAFLTGLLLRTTSYQRLQ